MGVDEGFQRHVRAAAVSFLTGSPLRLRWFWVVAIHPGTEREIALDMMVLRRNPQGTGQQHGTVDTIGPGSPRTGPKIESGWVEVRYSAGSSNMGTVVGFWDRWRRFDPEAMAEKTLEFLRSDGMEVGL